MKQQNVSSLIRLSQILWLALLVVTSGGLLEREATAQTISFGAKTDFWTGSLPVSVAVADFNGDGKFDLAVANQNSNSVSILLGTGAGAFGAKTDFGTGITPISVAVGDFNGDGKLDLAVANGNGNSVSILLGTGTGSFGAKTDFGTGNFPVSVAVGDFNGDGRLDLAVTNVNSMPAAISILLGTGSGSFGAKTDFGTGPNPISVAVGDFNGDGRLDLAVANHDSGNTVSILVGTGTGTFGGKTDFGTGSFPSSVAVSDFNVDGKLDLAVVNESSNTVSILLGTGTGTFAPKTDFGVGLNPISVAVGDFNVDGRLDMAVTNHDSATVSILPGTSTGGFGPKADFGASIFPISVAVGDFSGDGRSDLAVANAGSDTVSILLNTTPIDYTGMFCHRTDFRTGFGPQSVAVGDFNSDGKPDLAAANFGNDSVSILLATGPGIFGPKTDFQTGTSPDTVVVADFNGDGRLDLAVTSRATNIISVLLGTGTGAFGPKTDFGTGTVPFSVAARDFNGDGKIDLAVTNTASATVSILLGMGTGAFGPKTDFATASIPYSVAAGDFNGDGKLDLAVANRGSNNVSILLATTPGSFAPKTDFATGTTPDSVAVGDFNGDGKLDLAVTNLSSNTVSILLGTGLGTFGAKTDFATSQQPVSIAVADFNGDGKLDLAVANSEDWSVSILAGTGTGSFSPRIDFGTGPFPAFVTEADFNADGKLDLATANDASGNVSILLNNCSDTYPIIFATSVTRNAGAPSTTLQIASLFGESQEAPSTLIVTLNGGTAATVNGVTVTLSPTGPNRLGALFADVFAACTATTADFTLRVTGSGGLFSEATLTVTVISPAAALSPISQSFTSSGGTSSVSVTVTPACPWIAVSSDSWITITSGASGTGDGTVNYSVGLNSSLSPRTGTMTIAGQTFTVTQAAVVCTFSISPTNRSHGSGAGSDFVAVTAPSVCNWTGVSNDSWITVTSGANGMGNGTVGYTLSANASTSPRTGTITVAGQAFTVTQSGAGCSFSINPAGDAKGAAGGSGSVAVTTQNGCGWTATINAPWISITSGGSGTGSGTVNYFVAPNTSSIPRTGTLTIAGETFTVNQMGVACSFAISPMSRTHGAGMESDFISVASPDGCVWTTLSNNPWITITSGSGGSGNGSVGYTVAANTGLSERSGTVTVAGLTFTITQQGMSCVESLATLFTAGGATGRLKINAPAGCNWTAMSNDAWITITSAASGTGASALNYSVGANTSATPRNGSLVIAGQRYLIAQEAQACTFSISPGSASFGTSSGTASVNVTTLMGCNWTAVSNALWITITSGTSGSASGPVNYSVEANLGSNPRTGSMTVAGQTFTVNQAGSGIVVVAPNGGETWPKGTTQIIRWTFATAAGAQVRIELLKGGVLNSTIVAKTAIGTGGIGSFNWLIPTTALKGSDFQVRITSVTDATFADTSDGVFTIGNAVALLDRTATPDESIIADASLPVNFRQNSLFSQDSARGHAILEDVVAAPDLGLSPTPRAGGLNVYQLAGSKPNQANLPGASRQSPAISMRRRWEFGAQLPRLEQSRY